MPDGTNFQRFNSVEMQDIFDINGNAIPNSQCVMDLDTNKVLGVHGNRYTLVRHEDVLQSTVDAVRRANVSQDYELKVIDIDSGRKLRAELLFNDLVVEPKVGDYVQFRVSVFNSYDASWSYSQSADGLRLWCLNGCTSADHTAMHRFKHTANIDVNAATRKIGVGLDTFMTNPDRWRRWMNTPVYDAEVEAFFKATLAKKASRQIEDQVNVKQLEYLLQLWSNEKASLGSNAWALYNAMTYWSSHTSDSTSPEGTRRRREDMLAMTLRTSYWNAITN